MSQNNSPHENSGGDTMERLIEVEKNQIKLEERHDALENKFDTVTTTLTDTMVELKEISKQIVGISQENKQLLTQEVFERKLEISELDKKFLIENAKQDMSATKDKLKESRNKIVFYQKWQFWAISLGAVEIINIAKDFL